MRAIKLERPNILNEANAYQISSFPEIAIAV